MKEYVIAVRSYRRPQMFLDLTYSLLLLQDGLNLKKQLYIFVADAEEKSLYEKTLAEREYCEIVVAVKGLREVTSFMTRFFPEETCILFLDDDLKSFFEFQGIPDKGNLVKRSGRLHDYVLFALEKMSELSLTGFTFRNAKNPFYLQGKPFAETAPFLMSGGYFGVLRNISEMIEVSFGHDEDVDRSCKFFQKDKSIFLFNWAGFDTVLGTLPGGMADSGDRDSQEKKREDFTKHVCEELIKKDHIRPFADGIVWRDHGFFDIQLQRSHTIRKKLNARHVVYPGYFETQGSVKSEPIVRRTLF